MERKGNAPQVGCVCVCWHCWHGWHGFAVVLATLAVCRCAVPCGGSQDARTRGKPSNLRRRTRRASTTDASKENARKCGGAVEWLTRCGLACDGVPRLWARPGPGSVGCQEATNGFPEDDLFCLTLSCPLSELFVPTIQRHAMTVSVKSGHRPLTPTFPQTSAPANHPNIAGMDPKETCLSVRRFGLNRQPWGTARGH